MFFIRLLESEASRETTAKPSRKQPSGWRRLKLRSNAWSRNLLVLILRASRINLTRPKPWTTKLSLRAVCSKPAARLPCSWSGLWIVTWMLAREMPSSGQLRNSRTVTMTVLRRLASAARIWTLRSYRARVSRRPSTPSCRGSTIWTCSLGEYLFDVYATCPSYCYQKYPIEVLDFEMLPAIHLYR